LKIPPTGDIIVKKAAMQSGKQLIYFGSTTGDKTMSMWNPWRGCRRYSEGCKFCYIHKGDAKRGVDTGNIIKTDDFNKPIAQKKNGEYKMKGASVKQK